MPAEAPYLQPPVTPPGSNTAVINGNSQIASVALSAQEQSIFKRDLSRIAAMYGLERPLYDLLMADADALMAIASLAKGSIGTNPTFTGVLASGNEIGMQMIRAPTVLSNNAVNNAAATVPVYSWVQTYIASGWTNIFGSAASYVDLSSTGIATYSVTNTQNVAMLAIVGLIDPTPSPQIQEVRFHVQNVDYPVEPIAWEEATDLYFARLQGIYVIPVNGRFYMRGNIQPSTTGGIDQTELFGLTFSTGNYLTYE
ncbi:MAG: hypothetical protein WAV54_13300 [Acidimicrobiales bacterium]